MGITHLLVSSDKIPVDTLCAGRNMPPSTQLPPSTEGFDLFPIIQVSPAVMQVVGRGWSSAKSESAQVITWTEASL